MKFSLPLASLALEPGVEPRAGDTVDITGEARVEAVQDGQARLVLVQVNGSAPSATPESPADDTDPDDDTSPDEAALEQQAADEDTRRYR